MNLDGYAGAGGWDEGARQLGLTNTVGIDNWLDACRTGKAAGHARICADLSTYPTAPFAGRVQGAILSPPCQPYSSAGTQLGKLDQPRVAALVDRMAAGDDRWQDMTWEDDRSHHAAQPVRWVRDLRPEWVGLEQVPEVLPLWEHIGRVFRGWGYQVWTGKLCAADYGVPQTRVRAVLIASRVRRVGQPTPTHYDPRKGNALFGQPWVPMADALGWSAGDVLQNRRDSPKWVELHGARENRTAGSPAPTITGEAHRWTLARPATTVAGDPRISRPGHRDRAGGERQHAESIKVTAEEAAVLQGFRPDYPWQGNRGSIFKQIGNAVPPGLAAAVIAEAAGVPAAADLGVAA